MKVKGKSHLSVEASFPCDCGFLNTLFTFFIPCHHGSIVQIRLKSKIFWIIFRSKLFWFFCYCFFGSKRSWVGLHDSILKVNRFKWLLLVYQPFTSKTQDSTYVGQCWPNGKIILHQVEVFFFVTVFDSLPFYFPKTSCKYRLWILSY